MYYRQADPYNFRGRGGKQVSYIVIHYDAGTKATARNNVDAFATHKPGTSAHYFVDENEVAQSVPESMSAQHCGGRKYNNGAPAPFHLKCMNANSIGIELCSRKNGWGEYYIPVATQNRAARLVAELMKRYHVDMNHLIRHYDVTGKHCPEPFVREPRQWEDFKDLVEKYLDPVEEEKEVKEDMVYYEKISDIPDDVRREVVQDLVTKGVIKGTDTGLHLSEDMVRILAYLRRAKVV